MSNEINDYKNPNLNEFHHQRNREGMLLEKEALTRKIPLEQRKEALKKLNEAYERQMSRFKLDSKK